MSVEMRALTGAGTRLVQDEPAGRSVYLTSLRRRWLVVLLAAVFAAAAAYLVSDRVLPTTYRSSATVIVLNQAQPTPAGGAVPIQPFVDDQSLSETFQSLALQPDVTDQVARDMGLRPSEASRRVGARAIPRTPLVVLSFDASSPDEAARGARSFAAQFVQSTHTGFLPGRALIVSGAIRPTQPIAPRPVLNALVAGLAGLLLGLAVVLARARQQWEADAAVLAAAAPAEQPTWPLPSGSRRFQDAEFSEQLPDMFGSGAVHRAPPASAGG
jgi:capsular polysaccharide biosynthesis protein